MLEELVDDHDVEVFEVDELLDLQSLDIVQQPVHEEPSDNGVQRREGLHAQAVGRRAPPRGTDERAVGRAACGVKGGAESSRRSSLPRL